jgi:hypothetical protein
MSQIIVFPLKTLLSSRDKVTTVNASDAMFCA